MHKHPGKIVFCLMLLTALALMAVTGSRVDFTAGTTPGNPGAGKFRLWANSGSGQLECLNSSGGSCMPTGGGTPAGSTNDIQFNNAGSFGGGRCTMDSSSNVSCAGSMTTGSGGGTTGSVALSGATSGTVTIQPQAVAGTYNFNLPTSAGTSGQPLLSAGGGASPMTYGSTSGSGSFCLTTSCVMTTPNLGTPSAATLTNATGLPLSGLTTQSADTVVMNATGSSASPTAVAMPTSGTNGCAGTSNALTYNTSTHALGCNSISGGSTPAPEFVTWDSASTCNAGNTNLVSYYKLAFFTFAACDGTTRHYYGYLGELTPPPALANWTTLNAANPTESGGVISIAPTPNATLTVDGISINQPSTPYSASACWFQPDPILNSMTSGFGFYDGTKIVDIEFLTQGATNGTYRSQKWTNSTTISTTGTQNYVGPRTTTCVLATNNGTTLTLSYSIDKQNWFQIYSEAVGTFITPTKLIWSAINNQATATNVNQPTLFHYRTF